MKNPSSFIRPFIHSSIRGWGSGGGGGGLEGGVNRSPTFSGRLAVLFSSEKAEENRKEARRDCHQVTKRKANPHLFFLTPHIFINKIYFLNDFFFFLVNGWTNKSLYFLFFWLFFILLSFLSFLEGFFSSSHSSSSLLKNWNCWTAWATRGEWKSHCLTLNGNTIFRS